MRNLTSTILSVLLSLILLPEFTSASAGGKSTFTTYYPVPYFQDFNSSTVLPADWSGTMEVMTQHGTGNSNGLAFNLYDDPLAQTCQSSSPMIQLSTNPCRLTFQYRLADFSNYPNNATVLGPGDKIEVQISVNYGVSFTTIYTINSANHTTSVNFTERVIDLTSYSGVVSFRFLCTWGSGDYYADIDDFTVEQAPSCAAPYSLVASNISGTGFSVGWSGAPTVSIEYGFEGHIAGTGTILSGITTNPYTLTGLLPLTAYDIYVRQECGGGVFSAWTGPLTVTTGDQFSISVFPPSVPYSTGYAANSFSGKYQPVISVSTALSDSSGRGFIKFDISSLPAGAVITKAILSYYNFYRDFSSTSVNYIHPLSIDPVTANCSAIYADCGDGPVLWSGTWGGTAPVWIHSTLSSDGLAYISGQMTAGWAGFGIVRGSTAHFKFSGWDAGIYRPKLQIEYHIPTTPVISIVPGSFNFGSVHVGYESSSQVFTIQNIGAGILNVSSVAIDGSDAVHFILTDGHTYPKALASGESYTVSIKFAPLTAGVKIANLKVVDQNGIHLVPVTGTGYLNPPRNLTATPIAGSDVLLKWQPPLSAGPLKTSSPTYSIHRGTSPGIYTFLVTGITDTTYTDATTSQSTLYYYMVSYEYPGGPANSNEVSVTTFPGCPPPTNLVAGGMTNNSAILSWNANGATAWQIEWGLTGFIKGTGTVISTGVTNPYTLSGLSSGTVYDFYVRSNCGGGEYSDWSGPATFSTTCPTTAAPVTETFELTAFPPQCWSKSSGAPTWTRASGVSGYGTGSGSAMAGFNNISAHTPFHLMTLTFTTTGLYQPVLKFDYAYATYSGEVDSLMLFYSTDGGTTYTLLQGLAGGVSGVLNTGGSVTTSFIPSASQWQTHSITLPPGAGKIRFTALSAWGNNLYIDNVKIEAGVPPVPDNLSVSGVVSSGQSKCYNATQVITVAGNSTTYTLQSGASATFMAGQKVRFLAGTSIKSGSHAIAYINTTNNWCPATASSIGSGQVATSESPDISKPEIFFNLYPNPASGNIHLVQKGETIHERVTVGIYNMQGRQVIISEMNQERKIELNTMDLPAGIYFVRIQADGETETIKFVKTR